ncbi:MAG TPA: trypsin-like serine protease, partial [Candidatus Hydrogenedentes bacterium]|nr:trypsin-like serine protease [Candidatus Hydrogenedentota bacterium]
MRIVGNIALVCAIIAAASFADASGARGVVVADPCDKPCITEIGDVPWTPPAPHARPKVIYGEDDRIDVYQETDADRLKWAASTCALINLNRLTQHPDGSWTISSPSAYTRWGLPACEDEPFGDQPSAAFCTGFMVGEDMIVTAGHCYNTNSLSSVRFIFGFWMLDETTPRLDFLESEVYQGVEVVSYESSGAYDHSVVRVDRPITAPGAEPFLLRRTGVVEAGEYVGVIGHPAGLPMKIAFGDTYVRNADTDGYFVANLDTYGGNSGSPVINTFTGMLEGILVRGATDFVQDYENNCFYSNAYPNDGGRGEDVTKATVFAPYVPGPEGNQGVLSLDAAYYFCDDIVTVTVVDVDLEGETAVAVDITTMSGDTETLTLPADPEIPSRFEAAIMAQPGPAAPDSGALDVIHGDVISAFYLDEVSETGMPQMRVETAVVDCEPPQVTNVQVAFVSGTQVQIHVATDETATVTIHFGEACDSLAYVANSAWNTEHVISLSGFAPDTAYYFAVAAEDRAGNGSYVDNDGACYSFVTYSSLNYYTEYFTLSNPVDLHYRQAIFTPYDHPNHYQACITSVIALPVAPGGEQISLGDDAYAEIPFTHGAPITFYGADYDCMYIGSNGYITFGAGDDTYQP